MRIFKEYLYVIISSFILAVATIYLILPNKLVCGGMSGLTLIAYHFLKIDEAIIITVLTGCLFIVGWLFMGNDFAKKTLLSSVAYPIFTYLLMKLNITVQIDPLLAGIYAGILSGFAIGLTMSVNGSTGGMDIPPLILSKLTGINVATLVLFTDGSIVLIGAIIYGLTPTLIGIIVLLLTSYTLNKTLTFGTFQSKKVEIISDKYLELNEALNHSLDYGTTISDVAGGYSKQHKKMITCVIHNKSYQKVIDLIDRYDEKAFVVVSDAYEVKGEGFSYAKRLAYLKK